MSMGTHLAAVAYVTWSAVVWLVFILTGCRWLGWSLLQLDTILKDTFIAKYSKFGQTKDVNIVRENLHI